jgi:hypothetical protein
MSVNLTYGTSAAGLVVAPGKAQERANAKIRAGDVKRET